jgi:hypothetical protein
MKQTLIVILSICCWQWAEAQIPDFARNPTSGNTSGSGAAPNNQNFKIVYPDSLPVHYFYADAPFQLYALDDTLLDNFQQYDPTRQLSYFDYSHLGDVGLPHRPFMYQPIEREGFHFGLNQFHLLEWNNDKVRYFVNPKPYTEAYYSQANSQDEFILKAIASIKLTDKIKAAADFRRIRQDGVYQRQALKHGNLTFSAWYRSPDNRHQAYFSYLTNNFFQQNNGGLENVAAIGAGGLFDSRSLLSVNLSAAQSQYNTNKFSITNYWNLNRRKSSPISIDSLPPIDSLNLGRPKPVLKSKKNNNQAQILVMHRLTYDASSYKFYDTSPPEDSTVYGNLMVDSRGLRNVMSYRAIENVAKARLSYYGNLDVGLRYKLFFIDQEPRDTIIHNLFLMGDWQLDTKRDNFGAKAKFRFGLLDNGADYLLDAEAFLNIGKIGKLNGQLLSQRYSPALMQHRVFISQQEVWNNDFNKPIENSLMVSLAIPRTRTTLHFQNHLINNLIYYDTLAIPQQANAAVNILQFLVSQNFKLRAFHLDNTVGFQQVSNTNLLHFPTLMSKHSMYFEGILFKVALSRIGIDVRYNTDYYADNFQPATGQFYLQNHTLISNPPLIDVFFATKIQTLRVFAKVENLNELIFTDTFFATNNYTLMAPQYPIRDWTIRFGLHWRFYD